MTGLYTIEIDTRESHQVIRNHVYHCDWSADGTQMLYSELDIDVERIEREDGGFGLRIWADRTFRVMIQNIDDGNTRTLKTPENWYQSSLAWMDSRQYFSAPMNMSEITAVLLC